MRKIRRNKLGRDIKVAIRELRYLVATNGRLTVYQNNSMPRLPNAHRGNVYYEFDVGSGRFNRGRARIVALFAPNRLLKMYFTNTHYTSWMEIA